MSKPSLLFLAHRIPYPPNKGDKIRSFHMLRHLGHRFDVHLGCFVDDPEDWRFIDQLKKICVSVYARPIKPKLARLRSFAGFLSDEPLSVAYYRDAKMAHWVKNTIEEEGVDGAYIFSSAVGQFIPKGFSGQLMADFVDVDSEKWRQYAQNRVGPMAWVYAREARCLQSYDRELGLRAKACFLVSMPEAHLFGELIPELKSRTHALPNGVDLHHFDPKGHPYANPFTGHDQTITFAGAMDYAPNVDAVCWFSEQVWPKLSTLLPKLQFAIVGSNPTKSVRALSRKKGISVLGKVADIRPYLVHAAAAVAPLRIARGVQNKVLEAMAMNTPIVSSPQALEGLESVVDPQAGVSSVDDWVNSLKTILENDQLKVNSRELIVRHFSWQAAFDELDKHIEFRDD